AYSTEVLSLFDALATPLRAHRERTYSAPLATRAFARETVETTGPDGKPQQIREFPRLIWGGAHLKNEADRGADIAMRSALGLAVAAAIWGALAAAVSRKQPWRAIVRGETRFPWRAVLLTALALL